MSHVESAQKTDDVLDADRRRVPTALELLTAAFRHWRLFLLLPLLAAAAAYAVVSNTGSYVSQATIELTATEAADIANFYFGGRIEKLGAGVGATGGRIAAVMSDETALYRLTYRAKNAEDARKGLEAIIAEVIASSQPAPTMKAHLEWRRAVLEGSVVTLQAALKDNHTATDASPTEDNAAVPSVPNELSILALVGAVEKRAAEIREIDSRLGGSIVATDVIRAPSLSTAPEPTRGVLYALVAGFMTLFTLAVCLPLYDAQLVRLTNPAIATGLARLRSRVFGSKRTISAG
jgi:hypothetical protein